MATIKLKKSSATPADPLKPKRSPVRGMGSAPRKRPTLAEAQTARAEREARYQEQLRQRFGDKPPEKFKRRDEGDAFDRKPAPRRNPLEGVDQSSRGKNTAFSGGGSVRRMAPADPRDEASRPPQRSERVPSEVRRDAAPRRARPDEPRRAGPVPSDARRSDAGARKPHRKPADARHHVDDHQDIHPEIPGSMRLSKRMSELGIASRREADEWIAKGWVRVDDHVVSELGSRVTPDQRITVDARARHQQAQRVTVLLNKPIGYVSGQAEDGYEPASVLVTPQNQWRDDHSGIRFLREHLRSLAPAGRLDIDSVGLLVLTQDGRIAKQLIGEDSDTEKEYLVRVQMIEGGRLSDDKLALLNHGLELDGEALRPAQVEWVNDDQLRFVLKEGKKRQIRRMCELVGLKVVGLKRVRIGRVMLGDLPPGQWRYLRPDENFG
ncbi:pseudouridine synthase [Piscinibacter terrae]|uniref:Dual-specificity RNA pseudouridine synthase RluF n=1 Tax=Piscinibacter terrae TaxID=2496871 RepID=A0A3N7J4V6_9BURK|nr:pseudouridine synthase [Albitalea terrae]RQP25862.1 rRNA pseudouridine synthase [Albitalea terrae]